MSSINSHHTKTFALALSTLSLMTLSALAAPPPSRPSVQIRSSAQQSAATSQYNQLQRQRGSQVNSNQLPQSQVRSQPPQQIQLRTPLRTMNQPARLLPVLQSRLVAESRPVRQSRSPYGVMQDQQLQTVAGSSRPTGRTSDINAELRKLYEADGREMPDLPAHRPEAVVTPPQQNQSPQNTAQSTQSPSAEPQFESVEDSTFYRPNYLSAGKGSRSTSTGSDYRQTGTAPVEPRKPNAFKRFFGKLGIGSNEQPQPAPQVTGTNPAIPNQPPTKQVQANQTQPRLPQNTPATQPANVAQTKQAVPRPQTQAAGRLTVKQNPFEQNLQQQQQTAATPAKRRIELSPVEGSTRNLTTKLPHQSEEDSEDFGALLNDAFADDSSDDEAPAMEPSPFGQVVVERATETVKKELPEEVLVQQPGRIEMDLMNAFGDFEEEPMEESLDLELESPTLNVAQQQLNQERTPEVSAEVPFIANEEEPIRLELKAHEGPITTSTAAPIQEPLEAATQTVDMESPFLMDLEETEQAPTQSTVQAQPAEQRGEYRLSPSEPGQLDETLFDAAAVPMKKPVADLNTRRESFQLDNDFQDVSRPEVATGIVDVENVRETPGLARFCPITLRNQLKLVEGLPQFRAVYDTKVFWFTSASAKQMFQQNPELYTPANNGNDIVLETSFAYQTEGSAVYSLWYRGRLYLFASNKTKESFRRTPHEYLSEIY
ncbi:YHS domain protein [Polystyrenella longa]|uniref:YHS domain protein n=1 Tax=Polystyrenella longa TaxID=2528007 RepID=A0A518CJP9_9PLAN|nr:hypothetical protein [Polystyrenella longa]QDU79459.1 YHS domain protein [Polystyrenella longa]